MATPADVALQRQLQAPSKIVTVLWVVGLLTASVAITLLALREPVPGVHQNAYLLALSVAFFAGVAGVMAAVCIGWPAAGRRGTGRELAVVVSVVVGGLMVAISLLW